MEETECQRKVSSHEDVMQLRMGNKVTVVQDNSRRNVIEDGTALDHTYYAEKDGEPQCNQYTDAPGDNSIDDDKFENGLVLDAELPNTEFGHEMDADVNDETEISQIPNDSVVECHISLVTCSTDSGECPVLVTAYTDIPRNHKAENNINVKLNERDLNCTQRVIETKDSDDFTESQKQVQNSCNLIDTGLRMEDTKFPLNKSDGLYNGLAEADAKIELLAYIAEMDNRIRGREAMRQQNLNPVRPDEQAIAKLDSSLKKNTAFVRKLRNFTGPQLPALLKDMASLNLTKYISEVASALVDAKLKLTDVPPAVSLCSEMHLTYSEFSKLLLEQWQKMLSLKKDDKVTNPSKLRVDLRFYGDLIASGIFVAKDALPLLGNILTVLTTGDKDDHNNINIILSFCKYCGEEYAGLVPKSIRKLSESFRIPVPKSTILGEKQKNVRSLLKDYYSSLCKHLLKEHNDVQAFDRQNKRILQTKGELSSERKDRGEALSASYQKLISGTHSLAEALDEDIPVFPENTKSDSSRNRDASGTIVNSELEDGYCSTILWEDEETQKFYEEFPNLKELLPNLKFSREPKCLETSLMTEEKLDEEVKDADLEDEVKKDEESPADIDDIEEPETHPNTGNKHMLEALLNNLPNCINCEMIDSAAIEYLMYFNTKHSRKKLVKALFNVQRTRLDLLPFYARFVAILHPVLPDVANDLALLLKHDFKYHVRKKDQINIETKIKVISFIGELVKFQLYTKIEGLYCLKILLHDFTHHHIEMACAFLESCGRYFFRSPDTHQRTKIYLEQMMRMKAVTALDSRYVTMIENAYYYVNPPESLAVQAKERPPLHQFLRHIVYQMLMEPETEAMVLDLMRGLDWDDEETSTYAIKCLTNAFNVKYNHIRCLANLVAGLIDYQEFVGTQVVDGVLEDIRYGLESNQPKLNQRRIAMVKYLGELYMYRMVESNDIFKVLYTLISFGVMMDHDSQSVLDLPDSTFRIRLVSVLLDTCGHFFSHGVSKLKLDYFFIYFQSYFWFKYSDPVWTSDNPFPMTMYYLYQDTIQSLRPRFKFADNFTEAKELVDELQQKLLDKLGLEPGHFKKDELFLGTIMERGTEKSGKEWELESDEDAEASDVESSDGLSKYRGLEDDKAILATNLEIIERECNEKEIEDGIPADYWCEEEEELDADSDNDDQINEQTSSREDDDFLMAFEKMVSDNLQDRMRETVKPQQVDISVPLNFKNIGKKTYEQLLEPDVQQQSKVNFVLMVRKGNKQQYKNLVVPVDSELALNLRTQEMAKRVEMEKVKRLTLDINDRLEEEDYQDQLAQSQRPAIVNLNREKRHKYQHPKGAPDADLIFGKKKIPR